MKEYKIGLDIDDLLAAFTPHAHAFHKVPMSKKVNYWCERTMDKRLGPKWFSDHIAGVESFWKTLPVLSDPKDIDFEVSYYLSAFPKEMYQLRVDWLRENGFPEAPLIVSDNKVKFCEDNGIDVLVDDKPSTIKACEGTRVLGIHFITEYAGFEPVGNWITNLKQVNDILELKEQFERV